MNIFKKIYCRSYQGVMKIVLHMMPYREPKILESVKDIAEVMLSSTLEKAMIVTDASIRDLVADSNNTTHKISCGICTFTVIS